MKMKEREKEGVHSPSCTTTSNWNFDSNQDCILMNFSQPEAKVLWTRLIDMFCAKPFDTKQSHTLVLLAN